MGIAFVATSSGKFVSLKDASIPLSDLLVQRAFGINEVLLAYNKKPFALSEHLARLAQSADSAGLKLPWRESFIREKIFQGTRKLAARNVLIKVIVSGGSGHFLTPAGKPRLFILFSSFNHFPEKYYRLGAKVMTSRHLRTLPEVKSTDYFWAVLAQREAVRRGFDEVLYLDNDKNILEGTTFNFGIIKDKQLIAPGSGVLKGVTMETAIKLARGLGLKIQRRTIKYPELKTADEALLTSTIREISPVVRVDKITIGNGKPGKYTKQLLQTYRSVVSTPTLSPP